MQKQKGILELYYTLHCTWNMGTDVNLRTQLRWATAKQTKQGISQLLNFLTIFLADALSLANYSAVRLQRYQSPANVELFQRVYEKLQRLHTGSIAPKSSLVIVNWSDYKLNFLLVSLCAKLNNMCLAVLWNIFIFLRYVSLKYYK